MKTRFFLCTGLALALAVSSLWSDPAQDAARAIEYRPMIEPAGRFALGTHEGKCVRLDTVTGKAWILDQVRITETREGHGWLPVRDASEAMKEGIEEQRRKAEAEARK